MIYVKFGFSGLNVPKLVQYCKGIVLKMTGNANYVTPAPSLGSVITPNITALENAYEAALDGGKSLTAATKVKKQTLLDNMKLLASYVQTTSGGDATKILSSGFSVRGHGSKSNQTLNAPTNLMAIAMNGGTIHLKWKSVKGSRTYVLQATTVADATTGWVTVGNPTAAKFDYVGLVAGTKYWFRVAAINHAGIGAFSDVAHAMAII